MALTVISTAFTRQAIAVGVRSPFRSAQAPRRYSAAGVGHHRQAGQLAVVTVVYLQSMVFGATGFALGWQPHILDLIQRTSI